MTWKEYKEKHGIFKAAIALIASVLQTGFIVVSSVLLYLILFLVAFFIGL